MRFRNTSMSKCGNAMHSQVVNHPSDNDELGLLNCTNGTSFANLTAAGCSCESGWGGVGCNVCQTAQACQSGFSSVSQVSPGSLPLGASPVPTGQNDTLVCNNSPRVYASGEMSCQVNVRSFYLCVISMSSLAHFALYRTLPSKRCTL